MRVGETAGASGNGFFKCDIQGFEVSNKDTSKYAEDSHGWAYYCVVHQPEPYSDFMAAQPDAACAACYKAAAAKDTVFRQYNPILRTTKVAGAAGAGFGSGQ